MKKTPTYLATRIVLVVLGVAVSAPPLAATVWMGDYYPMILGAAWSYENVDNPFDVYAVSVFELIEYEGHIAVRVGRDLDNHIVAQNTGSVITVYEVWEDGEEVVIDEVLVLGEIYDGWYFITCVQSFCDTTLVRFWDAIDPSLREIYGLDPEFTDPLFLASYDREFDANLHNVVAASNLPDGIEPPAGAVTGVEGFQRDVGLVAQADVLAESGGLEEFYVLTYFALAAPEQPPRPEAVILFQNAPNPFNPRTTICFALPEAAAVSLHVYDGAGRRVRSLMSGATLEEGSHTAVWTGRDDRGRLLASGTFFYRLETDDAVLTKKMTLAR